MLDVLVVGPASWNQLVHLDALPDPVPHTVFARGTTWTLGGTSAGKALHLHDLGVRAHLHTLVGDDDAARRITGALARAGISASVETVPGPSERHLNLMDRAGGRVSIYLSTPGAPEQPDDDAIVERASRARAVVLDLSERSRALIDRVRATGTPVWTDLHDDDGVAEFHRPFRDGADYVFCNADALGDPLPYLHRAVDGGARLAVCTLGAQGAVAIDADHVEHRVAAVPVARVVDTNGAGDAFLAGVLAATLGGASTPDALRAGARQAVRALGSEHLSPLLDDAPG